MRKPCTLKATSVACRRISAVAARPRPGGRAGLRQARSFAAPAATKHGLKPAALWRRVELAGGGGFAQEDSELFGLPCASPRRQPPCRCCHRRRCRGRRGIGVGLAGKPDAAGLGRGEHRGCDLPMDRARAVAEFGSADGELVEAVGGEATCVSAKWPSGGMVLIIPSATPRPTSQSSDGGGGSPPPRSSASLTKARH